MNFWRLAIAAIVGLALVGASASSAAGAIATERAEWYVEDPAAVTLAEPTNVDAEIVPHTETTLGERFTLRTVIGGIPVHLTATGLECIGCVAENKGVTEKLGAPIAVMTGRLKFTGVTADEPNKCVVSSETGQPEVILTKTLTMHADFMHNGEAYVEIFPSAGVATPYARVELSGGGCVPIAGFRNITGTLYARLQQGTQNFDERLELEFSPAIQTTTGAVLRFGPGVAELTGTAGLKLTKEPGTAVPTAVQP